MSGDDGLICHGRQCGKMSNGRLDIRALRLGVVKSSMDTSLDSIFASRFDKTLLASCNLTARPRIAQRVSIASFNEVLSDILSAD